LRVAKTCARCGESFVGIAQAKYCSDACRMAAARDRHEQQALPETETPKVKAELKPEEESWRDYFARTFPRPLNEEDIELADAMDRIRAMWIANGSPVLEDSTEMIRRMREERSEYLGSL
jgi:hypothetical protein